MWCRPHDDPRAVRGPYDAGLSEPCAHQQRGPRNVQPARADAMDAIARHCMPNGVIRRRFRSIAGEHDQYRRCAFVLDADLCGPRAHRCSTVMHNTRGVDAATRSRRGSIGVSGIRFIKGFATHEHGYRIDARHPGWVREVCDIDEVGRHYPEAVRSWPHGDSGSVWHLDDAGLLEPRAHEQRGPRLTQPARVNGADAVGRHRVVHGVVGRRGVGIAGEQDQHGRRALALDSDLRRPGADSGGAVVHHI
mmetsp:Transcript_1644/g.4915  ORF Transcript_1644/g.4915 Transcript_1644/m.4915 type:complete len:249 (-) Transcript_1644:114-860(-)